jgi:endonuclease III
MSLFGRHPPPESTTEVKVDWVIQALTQMEKTIMATLADIQTALATDEAAETKIIGLLNTQAQNIKDLSTQLAAAIASGDPAAMQAVVDQMNADAATMTAAAASVTPAPAAA